MTGQTTGQSWNIDLRWDTWLDNGKDDRPDEDSLEIG